MLDKSSKYYSIKERNVLIYFVVIFFVSIGPIFNNLPIKLLFILLAMFCYTIIARPIKKSSRHTLMYGLILFFLLTTIVSCYINKTLVPLPYAISFNIALFCMVQLSFFETKRIVELLSTLFKYVIILAWIGYFYALIAPPLFALVNPNGTLNDFYLTTFSVVSPPIRPSGFYDEPGAFSFFICLLVFIRTFLGMELKLSFFMMIGGLVTQSAAHAVFLAVWILSILLTKESNTKFTIMQRIVTLVSFCVVIFLIYQSGIAEWAIERVQKWSEDPDSMARVINYNNVYEAIYNNTHNLLFGFRPDCVERADCEGLSENVLTPIAMGGLFVSWPFYLFLMFCFLYPLLTFKNFSLIGIGLLLLQRPYFLELPYSACLSIIITLFICVKKEDIVLSKLINKK
jgi:hypothetical protein